MARQPKRGLDYAPWDVNWMSDPDIDKLADAQGGNGILIYHYLCMQAYGSDGYFYRWSYDIAATTARRLGLGIGSETVKQTVATCFRIGLFDKRLFEEEGVLTSKGIQRRYAEAIQKRSYKTVNMNYWLLDEEETKGLGIACKNSDFLPEKADFLPENTDYLPDNPTKESKVKKSKLNNIEGSIYTVFPDQIQEAPTPSSDDMQKVMEAWNRIPHVVRINNIIPMTGRYDELRMVLSMFGMDGVMKAIRKVNDSEWMKNKEHITFDSFIANQNAIQKVLEGAYDKDFKKDAAPARKDTRFNDFPQRTYDFNELEKKLLNNNK